MYSFTFRQAKSFDERINEATSLLLKYPMKIPIIVNVDKDIPLNKNKYFHTNNPFQPVTYQQKIEPIKTKLIVIY